MLSRLGSQAVYGYSYLRNIMDMYTCMVISIYVYVSIYIYIYIYIYIFICVCIVYPCANIPFHVPVIFVWSFRIASSIPSNQNSTLNTYLFSNQTHHIHLWTRLHCVYLISTRCLHVYVFTMYTRYLHDVYIYVSTRCLHDIYTMSPNMIYTISTLCDSA